MGSVLDYCCFLKITGLRIIDQNSSDYMQRQPEINRDNMIHSGSDIIEAWIFPTERPGVKTLLSLTFAQLKWKDKSWPLGLG